MSTTDDLIRQVLLEAADQDLAQTDTESIPFSPSYLRWEQAFLRDTSGVKTRPSWKRGLSIAACFLLVVSLSFVGGIIAGPQVWASVSGLDSIPAHTATGMEVSVQLDGPHGSVYTSEKFACVEENGTILRYWYHNTGTDPCTVQLFKVNPFQDEYAGEALLIEPGESAAGTYAAPGNDVFYLRVTAVEGSGAYINGTLITGQYS